MRLAPIVAKSLLIVSLVTLPTALCSQILPLVGYPTDAARASAHANPDWGLVESHLPNPQTSSAQMLESQADILRARRFPEDALEYYGYAIKRGGDIATLLNKIGVTELELGNEVLARAFFEHVVKMRRNDPQAWNNLGAVDFLDRQYLTALRSYKRAVKLDRHSAVSHSNLGLAYVELKDYESARLELATALRLDPGIFQRSGSSGVSLHMLSTQDNAEFAFEMAKVYARAGDQVEMIHSLQTAAEAGLDVQYKMATDRDLAPFVHDERVDRLVVVAKSLRENRRPQTTVAVALPPASPAAR